MNFDREYGKQEAMHALDASVNELNKWLGFLDVVQPGNKKNVSGRGRPAHVLSLADLYLIGIFKNLKCSGFDRKTAAEMIRTVQLDDVNELVDYAFLKGVIDKLETISGLFDFLVMAKNEPVPVIEELETRVQKRIAELEPKIGIYLGFHIFHDLSKSLAVKCFPVVDADNKVNWSNKFYSLQAIYSLWRGADSVCHVNIGKVVASIRWRIRSLDQKRFDDWFEDVVGDDLWDFLLTNTKAVER